MAQRDLTVRILGDSASLERAFARSGVAAKGFGAQVAVAGKSADRTLLGLSSLGKVFAGGFAASIAAHGLVDLAGAASDLNEEINKSNVVFESSAASILDWSRTTAGAMGVSRTEALRAAATFGSLFGNTGQTATEAARLSKILVGLASDLASFNNTSTKDALDALRSGLSGEIEPLRRFQVFLTEAAVQQRAMTDTGKESAKQLTQGEKILARYELILGQTGKAHGDFSRTSGELANTQRRLKAELSDTQAELGQRLVPVLLKAEKAALGLIKGFQGVQVSIDQLGSVDFQQKFADAFGIDELRKVLAQFAPQLKALQEQFIKDVQGIPLTVPTPQPAPKGPGKPPAFGEPGFKPSKPPPVVTGLTAAIQSRLLDAQATPGFADDLKVLTAQKAMLEQALTQIGLTDKQVLQLKQGIASVSSAMADIRSQVKTASDDAARDAAQVKTDSFAKLIGALDLGVTKAELTPGLKNDVAALLELKAGLEKQIKAGVDVAAAQARLFVVIGQIATKQGEIKARAKTALQASLQANQFKALGLTATGDEVIPGVKNLKKQLASLTARLPDTVADTSKNRGMLARIRKVLVDPLSTATEETRAKIRDMFQTIRGEFDKQSKGPLTKTTSLNTNKLLDGLGLGRDMEKDLRARLSSFNSAGLALAGTAAPSGRFRGGMPVTTTAGGSPIIVKVDLDGHTVAEVTAPHVLAWQQRNSRRNPKQKRGPNSGV